MTTVEIGSGQRSARHDVATQPRAIIRRHRVSMIEGLRVDDGRLIGVPKNQVGVEARRDRALGSFQTRETGIDILGSLMIPGLALDQAGKPVLELAATNRIYVGVQTAVTAAKFINVACQSEAL